MRTDYYISLDLSTAFLRQAKRVWLATAVTTGVWIVLILAAPIAAAAGWHDAADSLYGFFGNICHQMPERSFHLYAYKFSVCHRCFGVYFGLLAGIACYPLIRPVDRIEPPARVWLFLAMIPIGIDWSLGVFGFWENTTLTRTATGFLLGAACGVFIMPAIVEIARLASFRKIKEAGGNESSDRPQI